MTLSARNQLPGTVKSVVLGSVMAEVVVDVAGHEVAAAVTRHSAEALGLSAGRRGQGRHQGDRGDDRQVAAPRRRGRPPRRAGGVDRTTCPRPRPVLHPSTVLAPTLRDSLDWRRFSERRPPTGTAYGAGCRQGTAGNRRVSQSGKEKAPSGLSARGRPFFVPARGASRAAWPLGPLSYRPRRPGFPPRPSERRERNLWGGVGMKKRLTTESSAGAAILLLAVAAPSLLALVRRRRRPDPYTTPVPFSWSAPARSKGAKKASSMNRGEFRRFEAAARHAVSIVVDENKPATPDDASDDPTYTGVALGPGRRSHRRQGSRRRSTSCSPRTGPGTTSRSPASTTSRYVYTSTEIATLGRSSSSPTRPTASAFVWRLRQGRRHHRHLQAHLAAQDGLERHDDHRQDEAGRHHAHQIVAAPPSPSPSASPAAPF